MTDFLPKDPKKPGAAGAPGGNSPLEDLVGEPAPQPAPEEEPAPIVLDMEEEPFVLDHTEAAPTRPETEAPVRARAPEAPSSTPAVIIDDPSLAATAAPAPAKPAPAVEKKKPRPDYTSDIPSIVPEGVRERFSPPPPVAAPPAPSLERLARARPAALRARPTVSRSMVVAAVTAALVGGGFWMYRKVKPPAPVLSSVIPPKAEPGQTVTVTGTAFDPDAADNTVRFGDKEGQVTAASETQLAVTVPASLAAAEVPLRVHTRGGRSNALFVKVYQGPRVTAVDPPVALPGGEVLLRGEHLEGPALTVQIGGLPATVKESAGGALRILVPDLPVLEGRAVPVSVQVAGEAGRPAELILGRLPLVTKLVPSSGPPGTRVAVQGHGFDPDVAGDQVTIGGEHALLLSATATEIAAIVPAPAGAGSQVQAPVVVHARGGTSSGGVSFVVMSPSESVFRPHYFPAAVAERPSEDVVFVSTELGPTLLLAGKADAPSTAERALRASAALNALVQAAAARPAVLETRDKPTTGVALAGSPSLLVSATPEDAAAYTREPSARGQRATPRSLAELWTALLQDHLALFVQRQRPLRMIELSPRGKVLLDLFSEAERRGGAGGGVPIGLVRPLTPSLARSFREMALLLPSGPVTAAAAVAGRWEGTMQEGAAAPRRVTITLRLDGARLSGSLTTRSRAVAMDVPLKDLTYDRGRVGFVLETGTGAHRWSGVVQGAAIEGTIREGMNEVGKFTLRYAE